jgi:hypothetical protein
MSELWPPTMVASAPEQRRLIEAMVQYKIEAGLITESDALPLFECLVRDAKLGPRGLVRS